MLDEPKMPRDKQFTVKVDDNYHYMDESERYDGGCYSPVFSKTRNLRQPQFSEWSGSGFEAKYGVLKTGGAARRKG